MRKRARQAHPFAATTLATLLLLLPGAPASALCDPIAGEASQFLGFSVGQCTAAESRKYCKVWLKQCKKRVATANKCLNARIKSELTLLKAECKLDFFDTKPCIQGRVSNAQQEKDNVKEQRDIELAACATLEADCVAKCVLP